MRNILKLSVILILTFLIQSCSGTKSSVVNTPDPINTSIIDKSDEPIIKKPTTSDKDNGHNAPKKSFLETVSINLNENPNFTPVQKNLIKNATRMEEKKVYFLLLEQDGVEVDIVMDGDKTRIMMSVDDIERINNKYRMAEILEELVKKYNIENELNLTIVESLTNEVVLLNERVSLLNGELRNKDEIITTLQNVIVELEASNSILSQINSKQATVIRDKDKEIRRQKRQKAFIASGAGVAIALLLLIAL